MELAHISKNPRCHRYYLKVLHHNSLLFSFFSPTWLPQKPSCANPDISWNPTALRVKHSLVTSALLPPPLPPVARGGDSSASRLSPCVMRATSVRRASVRHVVGYVTGRLDQFVCPRGGGAASPKRVAPTQCHNLTESVWHCLELCWCAKHTFFFIFHDMTSVHIADVA